MYPNLKAEMARQNLTNKDLSIYSSINYDTLNRKLNGKSPIMLDEAWKIKNALKVEIPLEVLFQSTTNS